MTKQEIYNELHNLRDQVEHDDQAEALTYVMRLVEVDAGEENPELWCECGLPKLKLTDTCGWPTCTVTP